MADIRDVIRFAGTAAPAVFGPLALANEASYAFYPRGKAKEDDAAPVGKIVSYLNEQPYKIYAGEEYGPQSVASYMKLRQSDPNRFPRPIGLEAAKPKAIPQPKTPVSVPPNWETPGGAAAGVPLPDATAGWGGPQDVNTGTFPAEARSAGTEPGFEEILKFLQGTLSPEGRKVATDEAIRQFAATSAFSAALGEEKSRQRYKRELELERIKQWTDLAKTTMQTNVLSQAMLGQALIASQQPNAAVADILSKGTQAAQGVLGGFQLRA
jgi:hypothetical protein